MNISFFNFPISNTLPRCRVTVKQIYEYIISGRAKEKTQLLRLLVDGGVRRAYKAQNLDYVTFSGCFSVRKIDGLISHSGFMCFDIDHIDSEGRLQEIKSKLINDELLHTVLCFRSPSGNGLKWVVEVPDRVWLRQTESTDNRLQITDDRVQIIDVIVKNHRVLYERIRGYLFERYGIETDHTSDIARSCYLCHDDDAYYDEPTFHSNPAHKLLKSVDNRLQITHFARDFYSARHNEQALSALANRKNIQRTDDGGRSMPRPYIVENMSGKHNLDNWDVTDNLIRRIESRGVDITGDYLDWVRLGFAFANGFGELGRGFYHRVSQFHPRYDPNQTNRQYDNCLKTNRGLVGLGIAIKLMHNA